MNGGDWESDQWKHTRRAGQKQRIEQAQNGRMNVKSLTRQLHFPTRWKMENVETIARFVTESRSSIPRKSKPQPRLITRTSIYIKTPRTVEGVPLNMPPTPDQRSDRHGTNVF